MPTDFELKQLKPKLDIAKKPENRVHELTDSNVSLCGRRSSILSKSPLLLMNNVITYNITNINDSIVEFKITILISIVVVLLGQCAFSRSIERTLLIAT